MSQKKSELWICTGPLDELLFGCNHDWQEYKESGCRDSKTYPYCPSCGLVCTVALGEQFPPECVIARKQQLEKTKKLMEEGYKSSAEKDLKLAKEFESTLPNGLDEEVKKCSGKCKTK